MAGASSRATSGPKKGHTASVQRAAGQVTWASRIRAAVRSRHAPIDAFTSMLSTEEPAASAGVGVAEAAAVKTASARRAASRSAAAAV